jgi:hypothetical protein
MAQIAAEIGATILSGEITSVPDDIDWDDISAPEDRLVTVKHLKRERNLPFGGRRSPKSRHRTTRSPMRSAVRLRRHLWGTESSQARLVEFGRHAAASDRATSDTTHR